MNLLSVYDRLAQIAGFTRYRRCSGVEPKRNAAKQQGVENQPLWQLIGEVCSPHRGASKTLK